jgi:hypothetical protein
VIKLIESVRSLIITDLYVNDVSDTYRGNNTSTLPWLLSPLFSPTGGGNSLQRPLSVGTPMILFVSPLTATDPGFWILDFG